MIGKTSSAGVSEAECRPSAAWPDYAPLFEWVRERESVRVKRAEGLPPPWTTDPIIANYRFCNVRREDDTVTIWIRENIRKPYADHPYLWLMLCIARQVNWPDTLHELIESHDGWPLDDWSPDFFEHVLRDREHLGKKVYTGAYTITAPPVKGASKITFTAKTVIGQLWRDREVFGRHFGTRQTIQATHVKLTRYTAWGDFMAYQAVGDMIFTPLLADALDREIWCAAGPGTIRGLNRLYGRPLNFALSQQQARSEIRKLYEVIERETGVHVEFNDVPNCLCETDKYLRVKNGEGQPRARYVAQATQPSQVGTPASGLSSAEAQHNPASVGEEDGGEV